MTACQLTAPNPRRILGGHRAKGNGQNFETWLASYLLRPLIDRAQLIPTTRLKDQESMSKESHVEQIGDAYYLNAAAILRIVYLTDPKEIVPGPKREAMVKFQGRVNAKVAAQTAQTGTNPDVWKVLEKMVSVDAIELAVKEGRDPTEVIYAEPLLS